tara:strand:- start:15 stop:314 length:300 start_codon:yes stop_codon:yes gene_type:complete
LNFPFDDTFFEKLDFARYFIPSFERLHSNWLESGSWALSAAHYGIQIRIKILWRVPPGHSLLLLVVKLPILHHQIESYTAMPSRFKMLRRPVVHQGFIS